jgi:hypothetical protein
MAEHFSRQLHHKVLIAKFQKLENGNVFILHTTDIPPPDYALAWMIQSEEYTLSADLYTLEVADEICRRNILLNNAYRSKSAKLERVPVVTMFILRSVSSKLMHSLAEKCLSCGV